MSDIVFESGTWPSRMICGPTWRTLTSAPGNAWRIRELEVLGVERDAHQERDRPVGLVPDRQAGRAERLSIEIQQPRVGLIVEQLDVGDERVGDHDPGQLAASLDDLGLPLDQADLGLGLLDHLDQVRQVLGDLLVRPGLGRERRPIGNHAGRVGRETDDPGLRRARRLAVAAGSGSSGMTLGNRVAGAVAAGSRRRIRDRRLRRSRRPARRSKSIDGPVSAIVPIAGPSGIAESCVRAAAAAAPGLEFDRLRSEPRHRLAVAATPATSASASLILERTSRTARDQFSETAIRLCTGDLPRSIRHRARQDATRRPFLT